jgi:SAM-dependent methyltransferase
MIKMYQKQTHAGNTPDFWEENWEASQFEESVRFCPIDPLRPLFEKYLPPGSLMLEGGCGLGHYLAYYAAHGRRVVGLDFAQRALKDLHTRQNHLDLCAGDVSRLPFADEIFDVYYSGGVVEHFEGGAENSLREARRVLKKNGFLLISVPYYNPLRRILSPLKRAEWRKLEQPEIDNGEAFAGKKFFQYAYRTGEFEKMVAEAGLRVIKKQGYAVLWGLYEIPLLNPTGKSEFPKTDSAKTGKKIEAVDIQEIIKERHLSMLKRLVVSEDETVPVLGLGVKFMHWFSANMMMYVCVRD